MSHEVKRRASLLDFVRYLRKHIYELADYTNPDFTADERIRIYSLLGAVEQLMAFAEELGDRELYAIMDDFTYALHEAGMGAPGKGKSELDKFAYRLDDYEEKSSEP